MQRRKRGEAARSRSLVHLRRHAHSFLTFAAARVVFLGHEFQNDDDNEGAEEDSRERPEGHAHTAESTPRLERDHRFEHS
jgi:hypothetical protein